MSSSKMAVSAAATACILLAGPSFLAAPPISIVRPETSQHLVNAEGLPVQDGDTLRITSGMTTASGSCGAAALLATAVVIMRTSLIPDSKAKRLPKKEKSLVSLSAFENELGVQAPVGFWDPLGFTADGNVASFKRRRSVELKHSRVCMLAAIGFIQPETTGKWPGFLSPSGGLKFADIPNGLAAISKVPALGWAQIVAYCGFVEFSGGFEDYKSGTPGDYGWKVLTSSDMTERTKKLAAEIANGRLAMFSIMGMFFQDGLTGSAWGDWALYTGSPLRAFEKEIGVQEPIGYFDPAGFLKDGDAAKFRSMRIAELKHSRVAMIAATGYIVPEYYRWPYPISKTQNLEFEDIPNGLSALSKVPFLGWVQIFLTAGILEFTVMAQEEKRAPGDFPKFGVLGWPIVPLLGELTAVEKAEKPPKSRAEISNGRLAMIAFFGMLFQDGLTGTAWGDWALYTGSPLR